MVLLLKKSNFKIGEEKVDHQGRVIIVKGTIEDN